MKRHFAKQRSEFLETEKQITALTKNWIVSNSQFPESYKPIDFGDLDQSAKASPKGWFIFKIMKTEPGSERLSINHTFSLNDSLNQPIVNYTRFIYNSDYELLGMYGSYDSTDFNYKPYEFEMNEWILKYGK